MARKHISSGTAVTLVEAGGRPVYVKSVLGFSDHVNDITVQITDRFGAFFAEPFPIPGESGHGGVVQINEVVYGPCTIEVAGTGAKGTVYYSEVR